MFSNHYSHTPFSLRAALYRPEKSETSLIHSTHYPSWFLRCFDIIGYKIHYAALTQNWVTGRTPVPVLTSQTKNLSEWQKPNEWILCDKFSRQQIFPISLFFLLYFDIHLQCLLILQSIWHKFMSTMLSCKPILPTICSQAISLQHKEESLCYTWHPSISTLCYIWHPFHYFLLWTNLLPLIYEAANVLNSKPQADVPLSLRASVLMYKNHKASTNLTAHHRCYKTTHTNNP